MWLAPLGSMDSRLNMDVPKNLTQAQRDSLIKWFYDQKYRPFHREVADYARQHLGITMASHALAKIIRDSSPPPGSKPQLWKSKFQAAGSSKGNKIEQPPVPHSTGSAFGNRNVWQLLCDDHLLDPEVHHIPPSAADAATASPVRRVELNVHSTFKFGRKALTNSDISALLLHATGTISAVTCDNCLKSQGVFNGCVVQAPGGPCAAKFNNSCSNCWFGGRANQCSLRQGPSASSHHRVLAAQDRKSAPAFRRRESTSSEDDSNNRRFTISGTLPKRPDPRDDHESHRAKRRRTLPATAETNGRRKPESIAQNDAGKAESGDGGSTLRNRTSQATSYWQETVPTGEEPDSKSVLDPGDMTRYLNHYMKYYATMTKGERTRERVLRNLELVAIDALNISGK